MIRIDKTDTFFYLTDKDDKCIPISEWKDLNFVFYDVLTTSFDNGISRRNEQEFFVRNENIYLFEDAERDILGLPAEYPFEMYIQTNGNTLTQDGFKYDILFYTFYPGGYCLPFNINGPYLHINECDYILSKEQYDLYNAILEFNSLNEELRTSKNNFIHFSEIRGLSEKASAKLDSYLSETSVFIPNKIKILVEYHNDILSVTPTIVHENAKQFTERFCKKEDVSDVYTLKSDGGKRTKVVLNEDQVNKLTEIRKKYSCIADERIIDGIMATPERYFDTDTFDLTEFYSDRVIKIGLYKPKYYTFICPYKSEWLPGIKIEDSINGTTNLFFASESELDEFEKTVKLADTDGNKSINWNDTEININNVLKCIPVIREQLQDKTKSYCKNEHLAENVLIIKENAEQLGYKVDVIKEEEVTKYSFIKSNNLNSSIELKKHQVEGIAWMQYLVKNKYRGCLLADDMGLGKTLQILYFLQWHRNDMNRENKPYLIVAPVSLLDNWKEEYERFFINPKMKIDIITSRNLHKIFDKEEIQFLQSKDIIITNYETIRLCQLNFCAVDYAVVVLDEAQKAKSPGTLITNSVKAIKSDFKIAVTGTPVENTLVDLWCILDFSVPGLLGTAKDFSKTYQNPLKNLDTDIEDLGIQLRKRLGIYFKRRLKSDIASELPKKSIYRIEKEMPAYQKNRYKEELATAIKVKNSESYIPGFMFKVISALRRISDSPYLAESNIDMIDSNDVINNSAKLNTTVELLRNIQSKGEKVIVFSDHKDTQRMLHKVIYDIFDIDVKIINGDMPATAVVGSQKISRQQAIDQFQSKQGFNIIIMSPLAAGIGLNITGANNVIHYSRFWNPAKENQATDRAYRIGQKKDVNVYYPMAICNEFTTFDETIDGLLNKKSTLAEATLFPTSRIEIKQQELYESLFAEVSQQTKHCSIDIDFVDQLDNYSFEAFTAALYRAQGYQVYLTPCISDKGVDVIALGKHKNLAIQSKHSMGKIGNDGIYEISGGKQYYENKYGIRLTPVVLCNTEFTASAKELADMCFVELINRDSLIRMIEEKALFVSDIEECELQRMDRC